MSRIRCHFVQFASYDFSAKKAQKGQKWPQVATVFRDLLENEDGDGIYPTHPRIALERAIPLWIPDDGNFGSWWRNRRNTFSISFGKFLIKDFNFKKLISQKGSKSP